MDQTVTIRLVLDPLLGQGFTGGGVWRHRWFITFVDATIAGADGTTTLYRIHLME